MTVTRGKIGLLLRPLLGDVEKTNDDTSSDVMVNLASHQQVAKLKDGLQKKNSYKIINNAIGSVKIYNDQQISLKNFVIYVIVCRNET